jgi:hypothetical protein
MRTCRNEHELLTNYQLLHAEFAFPIVERYYQFVNTPSPTPVMSNQQLSRKRTAKYAEQRYLQESDDKQRDLRARILPILKLPERWCWPSSYHAYLHLTTGNWLPATGFSKIVGPTATVSARRRAEETLSFSS